MQRCAPEPSASRRLDEAFDADSANDVPLEPAMSTRQVAQLLGIGQATVKRLANAGAIGFLRSSRSESRRFAPGHVLDYLQRTARDSSFEVSLATGDLSGCVAALMLETMRGASLDDLLDDHVAPSAPRAAAGLVEQLLARLPALVADSHKPVPALLAAFGSPADGALRLVECSLRGHGYSVLMPAESQGPLQIADVVDRVRARVVALLVGRDVAARRQASEIAASIAGRMRGTLVAMYGGGNGPLPRGVSRIRAMRDLGRLLRR
jgi:excisionase family DNA binding protein